MWWEGEYLPSFIRNPAGQRINVDWRRYEVEAWQDHCAFYSRFCASMSEDSGESVVPGDEVTRIKRYLSFLTGEGASYQSHGE